MAGGKMLGQTYGKWAGAAHWRVKSTSIGRVHRRQSRSIETRRWQREALDCHDSIEVRSWIDYLTDPDNPKPSEAEAQRDRHLAEAYRLWEAGLL